MTIDERFNHISVLYFTATPPFIPTITSKDDTSNFDEFEKAQPPPSLDQYKRKTEFSGKDLPFIGFTFTKSLVNGR